MSTQISYVHLFTMCDVRCAIHGGDVAQEVELSSGSRKVAGSIPPWACRSVPEQDT